MLSCFHLIPERYGRTDGPTDRQTDRFAISISRVSKKWASFYRIFYIHLFSYYCCKYANNTNVQKVYWAN